MTVLSRRLRRAAAAAVLAGLAVVLAVLPGAVPARAHTALRSTVPASGATVPQPVHEVTLTFTQPVKEAFTTVVVSAAGSFFSSGPAQVTGERVVQPVRRLPPGQVTVAWRAVAVDGFPVQGLFAFTAVDPASARVDPTAEGPSSGTPGDKDPAPSGASPPERRGTAARTAALAVPLIAAVGGVLAVVVVLRRRARCHRADATDRP